MAAGLLLIAVLVGCAPVATQEAVPGPPSPGAPARVRLSPEGGADCFTPCRLDLAQLPEEFELRIKADGFQSAGLRIRHVGDSWQADFTDLGSIPCLAIDTAEGKVYRVWPDDIRNDADAGILGDPQTGRLYTIAVSQRNLSWVEVLRLYRE